MPNAGEISQRLDRSLIFEFFWTFSLFEYALKREGFISCGNHQAASADWHCFEQSIRGRFSDERDGEFSQAIRFLLENPPKKQIVDSGRLAWRQQRRRSEQSEEDFVLSLVRTVRNNLFHGGKDMTGEIETERNEALLRSALQILRTCAQFNPSVGRWLVLPTA